MFHQLAVQSTWLDHYILSVLPCLLKKYLPDFFLINLLFHSFPYSFAGDLTRVVTLKVNSQTDITTNLLD